MIFDQFVKDILKKDAELLEVKKDNIDIVWIRIYEELAKLDEKVSNDG